MGDPGCFGERSFKQRPESETTTQKPRAFFVEWWCHQITILLRPMSGHIDSGPLGCLSQRSSKCLLHLAEHRAKKDWLGDVLAFLISDQH